MEGTSVDGPGLRTSIYFAGCNHRCPGCHNSQTWPFDSGQWRTWDELDAVIDYNRFNVTFSGGDPFYQAEAVASYARHLKDKGYGIWCYTGFLYEDLLNEVVPGARALIDAVDVLIDGPYIECLRDTSLIFRGSANQRLIDIAASSRAGRVVLWKAEE